MPPLPTPPACMIPSGFDEPSPATNHASSFVATAAATVEETHASTSTPLSETMLFDTATSSPTRHAFMTFDAIVGSVPPMTVFSVAICVAIP